jgi:hypothetical protein
LPFPFFPKFLELCIGESETKGERRTCCQRDVGNNVCVCRRVWVRNAKKVGKFPIGEKMSVAIWDRGEDSKSSGCSARDEDSMENMKKMFCLHEELRIKR